MCPGPPRGRDPSLIADQLHPGQQAVATSPRRNPAARRSIWSSRAGGVDAVQALTLALVALGNHLSAERETGRSISYLGGEELGLLVTQVSEGGVVPPAMIRFAR